MSGKKEELLPPPGKKGPKWPRVRPGYAWLLCMILCFLVISGFEDRIPLVWAAGICLKITIFVLALQISDVGRKFFLATISLAVILAGASVRPGCTAGSWRPRPAHMECDDVAGPRRDSSKDRQGVL